MKSSDIAGPDQTSVVELVNIGMYFEAIQFINLIYACPPNEAMVMVDEIMAISRAEQNLPLDGDFSFPG